MLKQIKLNESKVKTNWLAKMIQMLNWILSLLQTKLCSFIKQNKSVSVSSSKQKSLKDYHLFLIINTIHVGLEGGGSSCCIFASLECACKDLLVPCPDVSMFDVMFKCGSIFNSSGKVLARHLSVMTLLWWLRLDSWFFLNRLWQIRTQQHNRDRHAMIAAAAVGMKSRLDLLECLFSPR